MGKTFHLKRRADHITGTAGKDGFLALAAVIDGQEYPTWTNRDVLDGGRGADTITAEVDGASLTPRMKSIEKAVLSRNSTDALALDLAKAGNLRAITLDDFHSDATISHAARLNAFSVLNVAMEAHSHAISGIDASKVGSVSWRFENTAASLNVGTVDGLAFKALDLALSDSNVTLAGDFGAKALAIHSNGSGTEGNTLVINGDALASSETVAIDGAASLGFTPGTLSKLVSFDASAMTNYLTAEIDAAQLLNLKTGSGDDSITLISLGGTAAQKAVVDLGAGYDFLNLLNMTIDPARHAFIGGADYDVASFGGAMANVGQVFQGFESLRIFNPTGAYDFAGAGIAEAQLIAPQSDVTCENMFSGSVLGMFGGSTFSTTVHVDGALGSTADVLQLQLFGGTFGSSNAAFSAPDLSRLDITSSGSGANTLYLGQLGADGDHATVRVFGFNSLTLNAAANSTAYIDELVINNNAGVDLSGLANGAQAFVATGATINGGAGNDVLVGGAGGDIIYSGGGDNIVHGSLGADTIVLNVGSGQDTFIFTDVAHSTVSAVDTISGFGGNDLIHVGNLTPNVVFAGNVATENDGLALLSLTEATAFYATDTERLCVDLDHDGAITDGADLVVHLNGLAAFSDTNIMANDWPV
jgi:hypothetical protein